MPSNGFQKANYGSFYLWGDVPALMPVANKMCKVPGFRFDGSGRSFQTASVDHTGIKAPGMNWSDPEKRGQDFTRLAGRHAAEGIKGVGPNWEQSKAGKSPGRWTNPAEHHSDDDGRKIGGDWFSDPTSMCRLGSKSKGRKAASAMIAKIPLPLSRHIARCYFPESASFLTKVASE